MAFKLKDYQKDAIAQLHTGSILCGGVGSGKSLTAIGYYFKVNGGDFDDPFRKPMKNRQKLYIITTARKRDTCEWELEVAKYHIDIKDVVIDSWNNIEKYIEVKDAFFIFDEQRVVGYGKWTKSFLKITKSNPWILLSATPGDTWLDYMPVFIANGFYKNKTDFTQQHVVYDYRVKFPRVDRYVNTGRLIRLRSRVLVNMDYKNKTTQHHEEIYVEFNNILYKDIFRNRWNDRENKPLESASEVCSELRRVVNSDESRQEAILMLAKEHPRMIIFYNYDFELDILKSLDYGPGFEVAEWNGHKHQPIPHSVKWIYLVQYNAGAEGWNCVLTDTLVFYSENYSYKMMVQAAGRIDRLNTPFTDLYYYHLKSRSGIDLAISKALKEKKKFNESKFISV